MTDLDPSTAQREFAATEKRKWVRTVRACNNHCMFCLDSGMLDNFVVPPEVVMREMREGREENCQRLILSGGEASIHPKFLEFVKYGRELGYTWIQTITNGRRFSYRKFADTAAALGLNEVTFSIHAHEPVLGDELAGVPGAFQQALQGLLNARRARMVANVDVVLNRKNLPYLKEILDFFMGLGVHEFDLLWLVPFGRGYDRFREELFLSPGEAFPHLQRALEGRRRPGLYLWTNRFPVEYLEGFEWLIQEPYKLHDEVNGRREMFREFARVGDAALGCLGERCSYCFMQKFCPVIRRYRTRLAAPTEGFERARLDLHEPLSPEAGAAFAAELARHPVRRFDLSAHDAVAASAVLATLGLAEGLPPIALRLDELGGPDGAPDAALAPETPLGGALRRIVLTRPTQLDAVRRLLAERPTLEVELEVSTDVLPLLAAFRDDPPPLPPERTIVTVENHDRLTRTEERGAVPDLLREALSALPPGMLRVANVPPCIAGGQRLEPQSHPTTDTLVPGLVDADGFLDATRFTSRFIVGHYYTKSLRCRGCVHDATCPGLHINAVRAFGFRALRPDGGT